MNATLRRDEVALLADLTIEMHFLGRIPPYRMEHGCGTISVRTEKEMIYETVAD